MCIETQHPRLKPSGAKCVVVLYIVPTKSAEYPPNAIRGMPKGIHTVDLAHLALIYGTQDVKSGLQSLPTRKIRH